MNANKMSLAPDERESLLKRLESSRESIIRSIAGVEEDSSRIRPSENSWSILEVVEHVAVAEQKMLKLYTSMAVPGTGNHSKDQVLLEASAVAEKQIAPEPTLPKGRFSNLEEARVTFIAYRSNTIQFLSDLKEDLRSKVIQHPIAGEVDGFQLILVMSLHAERHAEQITRIKNSPKYINALRK